MENVTIIGLGLIGGSFAKSIRDNNIFKHIIGVDKNQEHAARALDIGLVDEILSFDDAITKSDLIILSIPVDIAKNVIIEVLDKIDNQTVIDVGSTKRSIIKIVENHPKRKQFVATHPMSGTENSGPDAAISNLFKNKAAVICNASDSDSHRVDSVVDIYKKFGSKIEFMNAEEHDVSTAYVSHISHVSSFALALTVMNKERNTKNIVTLASGGFKSTARLAKSDQNMWEAIFSENKDNVIEVIDDYIENMILFKHAIKSGNSEVVKTLIRQANEVKKVI